MGMKHLVTHPVRNRGAVKAEGWWPMTNSCKHGTQRSPCSNNRGMPAQTEPDGRELSDKRAGPWAPKLMRSIAAGRRKKRRTSLGPGRLPIWVWILTKC